MLRIAAAHVDITPMVACPLAGFRSRLKPFIEVASKLEANAVAFRDQDERCAILLTLDTLFVGGALHAALTRHFVEMHGQEADDLLVLASHTHFAPSLDSSKPELGLVDSSYFSLVAERCCHLIDRVMAKISRLSQTVRGVGFSRAGINRRKSWRIPHFYGRKFVGLQHVMAPNPNAPIDPKINTITLSDISGEPLALIWHFACHPTGFPRQLGISADYPGVVRSHLRKQYGELPVLFMQGFAGDVRPRVPESRPLMRRAVNCALWGPSFSTFTTEGWDDWSAALAQDVIRAFGHSSSIPDASTRIRSASTTVSRSKLLTGQQASRPVLFQRLRVNTAIDVVGISAEPLTGLAAFIPFENALGVGYLGDVFGYWPTDCDATNGGYEVNHFLIPFGLHGRLRHKLDPIFSEAVRGLTALK